MESVDKLITLEEEPIDGGLGVLIKRKTLYHGSAIAGTKDFKPAEDTTVGEGVYLTSEAESAIGYGYVRAEGQLNLAQSHKMRMESGGNKFNELLELKEDSPKGDIDAKPILYEVEVENLKLLDLRKDENIGRILEGWRQILLTVAKDKTTHYLVQGNVLNALENMARGQAKAGNLRSVTYGIGEMFNEYVTSLGYEGLITLEGGEGVHVGNHDTYVIFDPAKVKVTKEQVVEFRDKSQI